MATKKEKEQEQAEALEYLTEWVPEITSPSSVLEFRIEYGKEITDYVSVHLYYQKDGKGHVANLTYRVGKACGYRFRRSQSRHQLALTGYGYSKTYDVALRMFSKLGITSDIVNFEYR